jgi:hypothetical protein
VREQLGDGEWRRLVRWRTAYVTIQKVHGLAVVALVWLAAVAVIAVVVNVATGKPLLLDLAVDHPWYANPMLWWVAAVALGWLGLKAIAHLAGKHFERLAWMGHDPEIVDGALWKQFEAEQLEKQTPAILREVEDRERFAQESMTALPWWRREMSGAHLVWWVSAVVAVSAWIHPSPPLMWVAGILSPVLFVGFLAKIIFGWLLYLLLIGLPDSRRRMTRYYRWWARGWKPIAAALAPGALFWAVMLVGWLFGAR